LDPTKIIKPAFDLLGLYLTTFPSLMVNNEGCEIHVNTQLASVDVFHQVGERHRIWTTAYTQTFRKSARHPKARAILTDFDAGDVSLNIQGKT
jgi:hypothetical protein